MPLTARDSKHMARGSKAKKKARIRLDIAEPTPEQQAKGTFTRLTMAYRRTPVIDTLSQTGKLSARQFNGLARYRDIAIAEEKSPMRDSLDKAMHGRGGSTDGTGYFRIAYELQRLENALGALWPIARAVAVDDMTVSQWAAHKGGTTADGAPKRVWLETSMMDIRMAGERLAAAIGA
ncbi:MAG: hypothetical protein ACRCYS_03190 [Beijerinckiaceae bacterium]